MTIKDLKAIPEGENTPFSCFFIYRKGNVRKSRQGSNFMTVELGDKTGSFSTTCFGDSPAFAFFSQASEGAVVRVEGHVDHYQGKLSPRISSVSSIELEEAESLLSELVESCPESAEDLWTELQGYVADITHTGLRTTVEKVLEDIGERFRVAPAAISMHHAYRHGLLEHTTHIARSAKALFPIYQEVDPDLAMAGIILHDMGKCIEYQGEQSISKSRKGILQGHVVLGYRLARQAGVKAKLEPSLLERLEHIILSHQGELEWGAAAMAATPEAVFVSMVDNLDAKMGMVQRTLRNTPESEEFSEFIGGLQAPLLITPPNIVESTEEE